MHMPGHKRQSIDGVLPYSIDITEIDGFDNLHERRGILKELADELAREKNAPFAFPLVGGSTAGILAAVYALTKPGDGVIISRGCHKSVYRACEIRNLDVSYLYPGLSPEGYFLSVNPDELENALTNNKRIKLAIVTSPTYEGIISDIKTLSETAHRHGAKILVDAAHGAHLGYSEFFPADAVSLGADVSVESLHKTLPALTQTAALYLGRDIEPEPFENALDIFETSSPSYVLTASIDSCLKYIKSRKKFSLYSEMLDEFKKSVSGLKNIEITDFSKCSGVFDYDKGKIIISTLRCDTSACEIADILRKKYRIEPEMTGVKHIVCLSSICDTAESFRRLSDALTQIDKSLTGNGKPAPLPSFPRGKYRIKASEAAAADTERVRLTDCIGKISAQYLWAYPPGIPLLTPGEEITREIICFAEAIKSGGIELHIPGEISSDFIKIVSL